MSSSGELKLLLEKHSRKLQQLRQTIIFYEKKKCMFLSFSNLRIDYDGDDSVFTDQRRCGKFLRATTARRITPQNVTTL